MPKLLGSIDVFSDGDGILIKGEFEDIDEICGLLAADDVFRMTFGEDIIDDLFWGPGMDTINDFTDAEWCAAAQAFVGDVDRPVRVSIDYYRKIHDFSDEYGWLLHPATKGKQGAALYTRVMF